MIGSNTDDFRSAAYASEVLALHLSLQGIMCWLEPKANVILYRG